MQSSIRFQFKVENKRKEFYFWKHASKAKRLRGITVLPVNFQG